MNHTQAISIFKEIQARPYNVSRTPDDVAHNCYFKGIELIQRLAILGYTVRGRVGETYWDEKLFPADALTLQSKTFLSTHFVPEIYLDNQWCFLDPSFQPDLETHGFVIGSWENGKSCFPITKLYSQEESMAYQEKWFDAEYVGNFFKENDEFLAALNGYFDSL